MPKWTADDIPDLSGKTAVVTGSNSGIGYETALELARHGADVTLACRNQDKGEAALVTLKESVPHANATLAKLDLADLSSVRAFAAGYPHDRLDLLVNNAGVMALKAKQTTADGFEMQFGTNHLGHFALTGLLLPRLLARPGARVVNVSSNAHKIGRINFDDLQAENRYRRWRAYGQSKLANLLFTFELGRRSQAAGVDLVAVAAHPGWAATNLQTEAFSWTSVFAQPASMGALPTLHAATAGGVQSGDFFGPDGLTQMKGHPTKVKPAERAHDDEAAGRLWDVSEALTDVHFRFSPRPAAPLP